MKEEIWKDVIGYEGLYQVSNLGNVKSLSRVVLKKGKYPFICKEKILKNGINSIGYSNVSICKDGKITTRTIHQLVAEAFLNHKPCGYKLVVDHINKNQKDNRVENLQIITQRQNVSKLSGVFSSKYTGVSWHKIIKKWSVKIVINKNSIHLGYFKCELEAHQAYQDKLKEII